MNKPLLTFLLILLSVTAYPQAKAHYFNGDNHFKRGEFMEANNEYYLAFKDFDELKDNYKTVLIYNFIVSAYNACLTDTSANLDTLTNRIVMGNSWYYKIDRYNKDENISQEDKSLAKQYIAEAYEHISFKYIVKASTLSIDVEESLKKALFAANQCISVFPEKSIGYVLRGISNYHLKKLDISRQDLQKGIAIYENEPALNYNESLHSCLAHIYLARLLRDEDKYQEAKMQLKKADDLLETEWARYKPSDENYRQVKVVYDEKKKIIAEELVLNTALLNDEQKVQSTEIIDDEVVKLKNALELLKKDSNDINALTTCAFYYLSSNNITQTKPYIDRVLSVDSLAANGYILLGLYYMMLAENKREEIRKLDSKNQANYQVAKKKMVVVNDYRKSALANFEKAHTIEPEEPNIIEFIMDICQELEYYKKYNYYKALKDKL